MANQKKVWIIGGSTGFGASISNFYISQGWNVLISSTNENKLINFLKKTTPIHKHQLLNYKVLDLCNEESISKILNEVLQDCPIDLLIITSAISNAHSNKYPMLQEKISVFNKYIKTNSIGNWLVIRNLFPKITLLQKSLKIILFTSRAGWASTNHFGFYNISKSLLHHLILNLHTEIIEKFSNFFCPITILEPDEALSEMNKGSLVNPNTIVPIIKHIVKNHNENRVSFINKQGNYLNFLDTRGVF